LTSPGRRFRLSSHAQSAAKNSFPRQGRQEILLHPASLQIVRQLPWAARLCFWIREDSYSRQCNSVSPQSSPTKDTKGAKRQRLAQTSRSLQQRAQTKATNKSGKDDRCSAGRIASRLIAHSRSNTPCSPLRGVLASNSAPDPGRPGRRTQSWTAALAWKFVQNPDAATPRNFSMSSFALIPAWPA